MPSLEEHAKRSKALYGDSAEEVHEYIDSAYEVYGGAHRKIRHDTQITPEEIEKIFGEKHKDAKDIAIDHVHFDAMESCYKIGVVHDAMGKLCFIRFHKPYFENVQCSTCKSPETEKFAEVYVWVDWKERLKPRKRRIIPFVSLLFTSKEPDFSDETERWATLHHCYKCHQLGLNVLEDAHAVSILQGDKAFGELVNHALSTLKVSFSNAVGHEALISITVPGNAKELVETERKKKETEEKRTETQKVITSKGYRVLAIMLSLFWLVLGIFTGTSSRIAPKILQWNYILAWIIVFGLPSLFLLWLSTRRPNSEAPKAKHREMPTTEPPRQVINETRPTLVEKAENEYEDIYKQAFPELSSEEAELQETQEVGMDFEDEEN